MKFISLLFALLAISTASAQQFSDVAGAIKSEATDLQSAGAASAVAIGSQLGDVGTKAATVVSNQVVDTVEATRRAVKQDIAAIKSILASDKNIQDKFKLLRWRLNDVVRAVASISEVSAGVLVVEVSELRKDLADVYELIDENDEAALALVRKLVVKLRRFSKTYVGALAVATTTHGKKVLETLKVMSDKVRNDEDVLKTIQSIWTKFVDYIASFENVIAMEGSNTIKRIRSDSKAVSAKLTSSPELRQRMDAIRSRTLEYLDTLAHISEVSSVTAANGITMSLSELSEDSISDSAEILSDFLSTYSEMTADATSTAGDAIVRDLEMMATDVATDPELHERLSSIRSSLKKVAHNYVQLTLDIGMKATGEFVKDTFNALKMLQELPMLKGDVEDLKNTLRTYLKQVDEVSVVTTMTAGRSLSRDLEKLRTMVQGNKAAAHSVFVVESRLGRLVSQFANTDENHVLSWSDFFIASKDSKDSLFTAWMFDAPRPTGSEAEAQELYNFYDKNKNGELTASEIQDSVLHPKMNGMTAAAIGAATAVAVLLVLGFGFVIARYLIQKFTNKNPVKWSKLASAEDATTTQHSNYNSQSYDPAADQV